MSDFYIGIHSDASIKSFPNNRSGSFKTLLAREIDLGNTEYKVAIASVNRYYETSLDDIVFLREKRWIPIKEAAERPGLSIEETYPVGDISGLADEYKKYIASSSEYIGYSEIGEHTVTFKVGNKEEKYNVFASPILKSTLQPYTSYISPTFEGMNFELIDMLRLGFVK